MKVGAGKVGEGRTRKWKCELLLQHVYLIDEIDRLVPDTRSNRKIEKFKTKMNDN